mgnify:CR=1 FL=1
MKDKLSKDGRTQFWRCQDVGSCKGRLHTSVESNEVLRIVGTHSDEPDPTNLEMCRKISSLKELAMQSQETPLQLIESVFESTSQAAKLFAPSHDTLSKIVNRAKKKASRAPAVPKDRASIRIPENYATYETAEKSRENFLIGDSGKNSNCFTMESICSLKYFGSKAAIASGVLSHSITHFGFSTGEGDARRILVFGRQSSGDWMQFVRKLYVDGTFSLAPDLFYQIVVILAERNGLVIPICYALLPDKRPDSYKRMIQMIKSAWPALKPEAVSTDFEKSLMNAFSAAFPEATIQGCLFHLAQNLKKKLSRLNLMSRYQTDEDFSLAARMITALAFVPPMSLNVAIAELAAHLPEELLPVLKYFEKYYVGQLLRLLPGGGVLRKDPLFPVHTWSVHDRTLDRAARTNNYAEAAHRRLQTELAVRHPSLWRFINGLKKVQRHRDLLYARFIAGHAPIAKRKRYLEADKRLFALVNKFDELLPIEFLQGVASNFTMKA